MTHRAWPAGAPARGDGQPHRVGNYSSGARAEVPQSRFKGVYFVLGGRWEAKITYRSKSKHIGTFDSEEEAARAFDARARYLGVPERCNYDDRGNEVMEQASEPFRGVRRSRNKWRAVISVDGQSVNLGIFDTKEQAAEVCRAAESQNAERKRNALSGAKLAIDATADGAGLRSSCIPEAVAHSRKRPRRYQGIPLLESACHAQNLADGPQGTEKSELVPALQLSPVQTQSGAMTPAYYFGFQMQPTQPLETAQNLHCIDTGFWQPSLGRSMPHSAPIPPTQRPESANNVINRNLEVRHGQWFSRLNTLGEPEFLFAQVPPAATDVTSASNS